MTKGIKQEKYACEICGQNQTSLDAKKKHKQRNNKGEYGPSQQAQQIQQLQEQIQQQKETIQNLKQKYKTRIASLQQRIKDQNIETEILKQQILKFGKKKASQTKISIQEDFKKYHGKITEGYSAYKVNLFKQDKVIKVCQDLLGKLADVMIIDPPYQETMINFDSETVPDNTIKNQNIKQFQNSGFLYLWVTKQKLPFGLEFFKHYSYTYIDTIIWEKIDDQGNIMSGPGYYLDHQFEICLIGRKGQEWEHVNLHQYPDIIRAPRQKASQKPSELYSLIELLVPGGRYIELFARDNNITRGWISYGKQIDKSNLRSLIDGLII